MSGALELRGNELADFPLQRDGALRGREVAFDMRRLRFEENDASTADDDQYFLPVGNVTAAVTGVRRGVGERLAEGGSVTIEADRVELRHGSTIDFSGGKVTYEPGFLETSMVISEGRVFDIHEAPSDLVYDAVLPYFEVEYARWGVTDRFNVFGEAYTFGRFEDGYEVGFDAGSLAIRALDVALDGRLFGGVTRGNLQRNASSARVAGRQRLRDEVPLAGLFELGFVDTGSGVPVGPAGIRLGAPTDEDDIALTIPDSLFNDGGINRVRVVSGGALRIGDFSLAAGGELSARGGDTALSGSIDIPSGTVEIETIQPPALRPALRVTETARIDVSGSWINDSELLNPDGPSAPLWRDGGQVSLVAEGDLSMAAGSVIDVSGGAQFTNQGAIVAGSPGAITLRSVVDPTEVVSSSLTLDGDLRGYGLESGGALTLVAGGFVIGDVHDEVDFPRTVLSPALFSRGGFAAVTLDARGGVDSIDDVLIDFTSGARVALSAESFELESDFQSQPTGTPVATLARTVRLPPELRPATRLTLTTERRVYAQDDARTSIAIRDGATVMTEAGRSADGDASGGALALTVFDRVRIDGHVAAPAGEVAVNILDAGAAVGFRNEGIWLGGEAAIEARGVDLSFLDENGLRRGDILAGGSVSLQATRGAVVLAPGSRINVSGASGELAVIDGAAGAEPAVRVLPVATAAGRITLRASETILPYAEFVGHAGGAGAAGGTLDIALDLGGRVGNEAFAGIGTDLFPEDARVLTLGTRPVWDPSWMAFGTAEFVQALRTSAVDADGHLDVAGGVHGFGAVDANDVVAGGFDALRLAARQSGAGLAIGGTGQIFGRLPAEVRLVGDIDLRLARSLAIDASILGSDGGIAQLAAPHVVLGSANTAFRVGTVQTRNVFEPQPGAGRLAVTAEAIDLVGFMSLQGFGRGAASTADTPVTLAAAGDIRLHGLPVPALSARSQNRLPEIQGAFETAADLTLSAAQVYPTTLSEFTVAVRGERGSLSVARAPGSVPAAPLSAGGSVTLTARDVQQNGVVRAPLGRIIIDAGTLDATAVARAREAATPASPYNGARIVQALAGAANLGRADIRGQVVAPGALADSDYRLLFDGGTTYRLVRLADGFERTFDTGGAASFTTPTVDGMRLTFAGTSRATPGDSFFVRHGDVALAGEARFDGGSLTAVAGADDAVPFGALLLEDNWVLRINDVVRTLDEPRLFGSDPGADALAQRPFNDRDRPWTKRIEVRGASVRVDDGATIDLSGGGDIIAAEFRPGPGGSRDLLGGDDDALAFALVPGRVGGAGSLDPFLRYDDVLASALAPELPALPLDTIGLEVTIGAGGPIAAGTYTVMPRGYALVPGAVLARPQPGLADFPLDGNVVSADGVPTVAARFGIADTDILQQRPVGLRIESRDEVLARAEYDIVTGNTFFAERADDRAALVPQLPIDAGRLVLDATTRLELGGRLAANRTDGRGSQVDILADRLAVVTAEKGGTGRVEVRAADLNAFGADSLMLGGTRSFGENAQRIDLRAREVTVDEDVTLTAPELILGATTRVAVAGTLRTSGEVRGLPTLAFAGNPDGTPKARAFVRVSSDAQVELSGDSAAGGTVLIGAAANLFGSGSITIDGSSDVVISGPLRTDAGSIALTTSRISLGAAPAGTPGLLLPDLETFSAVDVRLGSSTSIDIYGALRAPWARLRSLSLDADAIRGIDAAGAAGGAAGSVIAADRLVLGNSGTYAPQAATAGSGELRLVADVLEFGAGSLDISGFSRVVFDAADAHVTGNATITSSAPLDVRTKALTAAGGGNLSLQVDGALRLLGGGASPYALAGGKPVRAYDATLVPGGALDIVADAVSLASRVSLPGGRIRATATAGDVVLLDGGIIDVAAAQERFLDRTVATDGGSVELRADLGDVTIAAGAIVDVSAADLGSGGVTRAGSIALAAPRGAVTTAPGSLLGGAWTMPTGGVQRWAKHDIAGRTDGGRALIDASTLAGGILDQLAVGGFSGEQSLRLRHGDFALAADEAIAAARIDLGIDRGRLVIDGLLDASAVDGGSIVLAAGDDIIVNGQLQARALAASGHGGEVVLESRAGTITLAPGARVDVAGRTTANATAATGTLRLIAARTPDNAGVAVAPIAAAVSGAARVEVIANRRYVDVSRIEATETALATQIGLDTLRADNDGFGAAVPGLVTALDAGGALAGRLHVMPGIEISSAIGADLTLASDWLLGGWRTDGEAGLLTLRADQRLRLDASLDDGIIYRDNIDGLITFAFANYPEIAMLRDDRSWAYRLVAGADLESVAAGAPATVAAANPLAVRRDDTADVELAENVRVRTGTGDIEIAAGGDLRFLNADGVVGNEAVVYVTGRDSGYGAIRFDPAAIANGDLDLVKQFYDFREFSGGAGTDYSPAVVDPDDLEFAPYFFDRFLPGAGFGIDGGTLRVSTGGDIIGPGSNQLATDWLVTVGAENVTLPGNVNSPMPTLWAVRYDRFGQNLGSFGGGDVSVFAGGDVTDLSVMLPTSGRPDGEGIHYSPFLGGFTARGSAQTTVLGGGDLELTAGGDLLGARLLVARGAGRVRAGGRIGAVDGAALDTLLLLGESSLDLAGGGDVAIEAVADFGMVRRPVLSILRDGFTPTNLNANSRSFFFTYGSGSSLALASLGGDVALENRTRANDPVFANLLGSAGVSVDDVAAMRTWPGNVSVRALTGDITVSNGFQLYPDANGSLEMLAAGSISDLGLDAEAQRVRIVQSDADPALLPTVARPSSSTPGLGARFAVRKFRPIVDQGWHAATPVHAGDPVPSLLVARDGTIGQARTESRGFRLFLAESARISAGQDVLNLDFEIQHLDAADVSVVSAGRDFRFTPNRNAAGEFAQSEQDRFQGALFSGPGRGVILAGRDVDLGTSDGIVSTGNLRNFALPDGGADVQVFAGAGAGPDLAGFFRAFVQELPASEGDAVPYLVELVGDTLSTDEAREMFADLERRRRALAAAGFDVSTPRAVIDLAEPLAAALLADFFAEVETAGVSATTTGSEDYSRGFVAIDTLFPQRDLDGSLSLLLSRIHTEDDGDINLFVPGGSANTGAATTASVTKSENELGVVVQADGDVRGFVRDDFFVNASRVFALFGGDILLWASSGDIDAGRGAKSALAAPPPQVVFDPATNQFVTVFPPEVSGSGIRNFAPPGVVPGNVFLFAPQGVISAGDAGIASAGNITIGAREVIGADNIDVGGTAIGVPQADIGLSAGLAGVSNVANAASRQAQDSAGGRAGDAASAMGEAFDQPALSIISVEVLGFGG